MMASPVKVILMSPPNLSKNPILRVGEHLQYQQEMAAVRNLHYQFILILNSNTR